MAQTSGFDPTSQVKTCFLPKDHSIQLFTDASGEGWGAHLERPVSKPNSAGCYGQLNSSSLHKQTRRNPLGEDVCSPVENHDPVPSLQDNIKSQTHSRVSECDGRPSVQVRPSPVDRMVTASTGVQTDLSQVVHPSCVSICHSSEPQTATVRISSLFGFWLITDSVSETGFCKRDSGWHFQKHSFYLLLQIQEKL